MGENDTTICDVRQTEEWAQLKEILADALACDTPEERAAFLRRACADNPDQLREAEDLLNQNTDSFDAFADLNNRQSQDETDERIGSEVGAYRIVRAVARGGMGAVYLAERSDGQFDKTVAIKILKPGSKAQEIVRRFRLERQILARLDHPNIAQLLDAGTTAD